MAAREDNLAVLAACCTVNVEPAVTVLYLHNAATVCSSKRASVADIKFSKLLKKILGKS